MLDKKELEFLTSREGNRLITGPPGSGKTHTLLSIIKYLIDKKGMDPKSILIFTFNRRGSKILRENSAAASNKSLWEIPIETFYSFCIDFLDLAQLMEYKEDLNAKILKEVSNNKAGYDLAGGLNVLNSVEQWNLLSKVISGLKKKDYPYTCRYYNSTGHVARSFLQEVFDFILRAQESLLEPDMLLKRFPPHPFPLLSELSGIYSRYSKVLIKNKSYNYGMLLQEAANILDRKLSIRKKFQSKYKYIIIDEFQETNRAQFRIISSISDNNCIFFGNDDQAIYGFRGAVTDNFTELYRRLKKQGRVFFLSENHRNSADIVALSDRFIETNKERISKENIPMGRSTGRGEIELKSFSTMIGETNHICEKIWMLNKKYGIRLEEMAILIKGSGYETHLMEDSLGRSGIPFIRRSSGSLLDNRNISYIIDFLRLASIVTGTGKTEENSGDEEKKSSGPNDDKDFIDSGEDIRILNLMESVFLSDAIRIDPLFYSKLKYSYSKNINRTRGDFWDHICEYTKMSSGSEDNGEDRLRKSLTEVTGRIIYYSQRLDSDIHTFLLDFLNDPVVGLFKFLMEDTADEPSGRSVWIAVGDFLKSVKEYVKKSPETDVRAYLEFIENLADNKFLEEIEESTEEQFQPDMVNILSFHQCKGMEFDAVFIPFINNNYLPSKFKYPQVFDIQLFGTAAGKKYLTPEEVQKEHMAGEVRLFYNGITRAKRYLYISSCRARGTSVFFERLREIKKYIIDNGSVYGEGDSDNSVLSSGAVNALGIDREWMLKKRSLVAMLRLREGLKVNRVSFLKNLIDLSRSYPPENWWDIKKETVSSNMPFELFTRPFTYSGLDTYRDCPFKYKARYYFSISSEESISLRMGSIYHDILLKFFKDSSGYSWDKLLSIIGQEFEKEYFEFPSLKNELISKIIMDLKRYHDNYLPPEPESSIMEKKFSFKIKKLQIEGRVDQINNLPEGKLELVDFKSGSTGYSKQDLKDEIQLKIYRLAIDKDKKLHNLQPNNGILMKYMCPGNEKKSEFFMPDDYYGRQEIESLIEELAGRIIQEDFNDAPKSFMSCKYCEYKLICPGFYGKED